MMIDVDGLSHHIDVLIHRCLTHVYRTRVNDITVRPSAYSYYSLNTCANVRRITTFDITVATQASSLLPPLSIIHHSPINFTSKPIIQLYSTLSVISHTFHHVVLPKTIPWLSFNSITISIGSLLLLWPRRAITNFVFESNIHHHHILILSYQYLLSLHIYSFPFTSSLKYFFKQM